jgi:hypothetical protein
MNASNLTLGPGSVLAVKGDFTEAWTGTVILEMGGTSANPTIGSISATGSISLAGTLALTTTVTPAIGTWFTVVNNKGINAASGIFTSLPQGSTIAIGGMTFAIGYAGGANGRCVTLKRLT